MIGSVEISGLNYPSMRGYNATIRKSTATAFGLVFSSELELTEFYPVKGQQT